MAQIAQAHCGLELVHLGVSAHPDHVVLIHDAEVLQAVQAVFHPRFPKSHRAALDGMVHLSGVETENAGVPEAGRAHPVVSLPEGVGRVVDHL